MGPQETKRLGVILGVDIGQRRDPTAICLAELESRPGPRHPETHFLVRHLERLTLGTPYPEVAEKLGHLTVQVARLAGTPTVFADATGVGLPVVDRAEVVPILRTAQRRI